MDYEVIEYSIDALIKLLADRSEASESYIHGKIHSTYFEGYFRELGAKTIIVEKIYVDRDFLEDFAAYYVRCFYRYDRFCSRLHFFTETFSKEDFDYILENVSDTKIDQLKGSYLGFIVVKPLPETIIGRTCLKTYHASPEGRNFPITRKYPVNLFGIGLSVETLAFQEQDRVAAACATSALWTAFQGTGKLF